MRPTLILTITVLTIAVLYAPQPLLPLFSHDFAIRNSSAALLISLTLAPLALAPLCYGYILESRSPVTIIRFSILLLAVSEFAFAFCWNFPSLLTIRVIQGLTIPAILTSLMTHISVNTQAHRLQRMMSFYIAATITGGFLGRLSSGISASLFGWRPFFIFLGMALTGCFLCIDTTRIIKPTHSSKPGVGTLWHILTDNQYKRPFAVTFCSFFVLASIMNFIPFRLRQIDPQSSTLLFGFIYTGYMAGIFSSLLASKIKAFFSSDINCIVAGLATLGTSLILLLFSSITVVLLTLFLLSAAMFLVHTIAANTVNQQASSNKGIVNGLYISFYYAGGTIGSYIPGLLYERFGWPIYIAALGGVVLFGLYNALKMKIL